MPGGFWSFVWLCLCHFTFWSCHIPFHFLLCYPVKRGLLNNASVIEEGSKMFRAVLHDGFFVCQEGSFVRGSQQKLYVLWRSTDCFKWFIEGMSITSVSKALQVFSMGVKYHFFLMSLSLPIKWDRHLILHLGQLFVWSSQQLFIVNFVCHPLTAEYHHLHHWTSSDNFCHGFLDKWLEIHPKFPLAKINHVG